MKRYIIPIVFLFSFFLYSCGDCDLVTADYPCRVREATITKFDPRLIQANDSTVYPVPTYSIHTFQFPSTNSSSGVLTNDTRFDQENYLDQYIVIDETSAMAGVREVRLQLVDYYPVNEDITGDVMLIDIDTVGETGAYLRFYGSLARFPEDFYSEDAYKFCDEYLKNYREEDEDYAEISSQASRYGGGLENADAMSYNEDNLVVLDDDGEDITKTHLSLIDQSVKDGLLNSSKANAADLHVFPGEVYYYKARNGKEFAIVIVDINRGAFEPNIKRLTLKFSELRGMKVSECPD